MNNTKEHWEKLVRAVNSDVIVIPDKPEDKKTSTGIIIEANLSELTTNKPASSGRIIAIGPEYSGEFKFWDRVQFRPIQSAAMDHPCGEKLICLKPNQILWGLPDEQL
jgi:co-chaperonin GroES (HSP10)